MPGWGTPFSPANFSLQTRRWADTRAWRCSCSARSSERSTWALPWTRVSGGRVGPPRGSFLTWHPLRVGITPSPSLWGPPGPPQAVPPAVPASDTSLCPPQAWPVPPTPSASSTVKRAPGVSTHLPTTPSLALLGVLASGCRVHPGLLLSASPSSPVAAGIKVKCVGSPGHGSRFISNTAAEKMVSEGGPRGWEHLLGWAPGPCLGAAFGAGPLGWGDVWGMASPTWLVPGGLNTNVCLPSTK